MDNKIQNEPFWNFSESKTVEVLRTDIENGISELEAKDRVEIFGKNIIENKSSHSAILIFFNQFKSPLILLLVVAGFITIFIDHLRDALFIFSAVVVNTLLGFYQEYKAEKAISELRNYLKERSRVIREGKEYEIDATELVPGDLIRLSQGDRVSADCRVVYENDSQVDESLLTGESLPVSKSKEMDESDTVIADQKSMIFAGTLVTQGIITAIVCRTDLSTELGKIAELVATSKREDTPLQKSIKSFSLKSGFYLSVLTLIIFVVGILLGYSILEMFLISVAIAVSAVPEGLPVAMTVILATGVQRMAKRKGVVRKLIAAEALGSTSVILTDKTGTLTMAKMELSKIIPLQNESEDELLQLALLNTNVAIENPEEKPELWRMSGKILETTLVRSSALRGIKVDEVKDKVNFVSSLPFNSNNKFSVTLVKRDDKHILVFVGAPDILINYSVLVNEEKNKQLKFIDELAESGERIIGVATKEIDDVSGFDFSKHLKLEGLIFNGFIALRDPIRPSVKKAIKEVEWAGIKVVVMSGDHRGTAVSVAREAGLNVLDEGVLDSSELQELSDEELKKKLPSISVISRVSPFDKLRVVGLFQELGEIVAMTGDGVNDAPSIKRANIGIAMGSGTAVTKDVADLVLLDDNFETIASAVEEGRQIMSNIRKVLVYLLSSVSDALLLIGGSIIMGIPLPMNALQILWVNFFSDSFPAVSFAFEKDRNSLRFSGSKEVKLFNPLMKFLILFIGIVTSALLFFLYWFLLNKGFSEDIVKTFIFASFGTYSLFLAFSVRSLDISIFEYPFFSNKFLVFGVLFGLVLMGLAVYLPFLNYLFDTVPLPLYWFFGVIAVGVLNILLIEIGKWIFRKK